MPFTKKPGNWQNLAAGSTPLDAAGLNDLEARIQTAFAATSTNSLSRNRLAILGPSTEANWGNVVDPNNPIVLSSNGQAAQASQVHAQMIYWLGGRLELVYNGGVSGDTSAMILARTDAFIAAVTGNVGWILAGTLFGNDFGSIDVDTSIANCVAIYDKLAALKDVRKVICTITNRDDVHNGTFGGMTATQYIEYVRRADQAVFDYCRDHDDFILVDYHRAVSRDSLYLTTPDGRPTTEDGIHPNHNGGDLMARAIAAAIEPHSFPVDRLAGQTDAGVLIGDDHFFKGSPSSEIQYLSFTGTVTAGTYTVTVPANSLGIPSGTTSAIAWNAGSAALKTALEGVLGTGNVATTGDASPWDHFISLQGTLAGLAAPLLTVNSAGLTGGTGSIVRVAGGGVPANWAVTNTGFKVTVVPRDDGLGNWCRMEAIQNGASVTVGHSFGAIASGAVFRGECELRIDDDWVNPQRAELVVTPQAPITVTASCQLASGISPSPRCFNPGESTGPLLTPWAQAGVGLSTGFVSLGFAADTGSVVYLGRCGVRVRV